MECIIEIFNYQLQLCKILLSSSGYDTNHIKMALGNDIALDQNITMLQKTHLINLIPLTIADTIVTRAGLNYSVTGYSIKLARLTGPFLANYYTPAGPSTPQNIVQGDPKKMSHSWEPKKFPFV